MAWDSPLTRWQEAHPYTPKEVEKPVVATTEKRNYSLTDPNLWRYFGLGARNAANIDVNAGTALGTSAFFGAVRILAEGVAMLDRTVIQEAHGEYFPNTRHPVAKLMLRKPHPYYTWFDFTCALVTNACLGNGYARIYRDEFTNRPLYLEHIPMMYCRPEFDSNGGLWYRISGLLNGRTVTDLVPYTDMIHIKGLSLDGVLGYDICWLLENTFAQAIGADKYTTSILGKGAFPSIAIKTDEELDGEQLKTREENINARIGGVENAGTALVLDSGQEVQYLQWSPLDLALDKLRTLSIEDVCRITKVPRNMLAIEQRGTYGVAERDSENFLVYTLGGWIEKIQEEFNAKLFYQSEFESRSYFFEYDASVYVGTNMEAEVKMYAEAVKSTLMTPNEARKKLKLPPAADGDELMVDVNLLPVSQAVEIALAKYLSSAGEKARANENTNNADNKKDTENEPEPVTN